jgi:hypothetical protein
MTAVIQGTSEVSARLRFPVPALRASMVCPAATAPCANVTGPTVVVDRRSLGCAQMLAAIIKNRIELFVSRDAIATRMLPF